MQCLPCLSCLSQQGVGQVTGGIIHYCQKGIDQDDRPEDKHGRKFGNAENAGSEKNTVDKGKSKQNKPHRYKYNSAVIRYLKKRVGKDKRKSPGPDPSGSGKNNAV